MKASSAWMAIGVTFLGCSSSSSAGGGGGSDSAATCGKVAACGGNIVGTWKVVASCVNDSTSAPSTNACATEMVTNSITASGTATFKSDMTYTVDVTQSGTETIVVPMSCLSSSSVTLTCADLSMVLGGAVQDDAGMTTTCTISGSNCSCVIALGGASASETGTYTVSGNTFTTTAAGTSPVTSDYCVQGNTLHVISTSMTTAGAMAMPDSDLVATKE